MQPSNRLNKTSSKAASGSHLMKIRIYRSQHNLLLSWTSLFTASYRLIMQNNPKLKLMHYLPLQIINNTRLHYFKLIIITIKYGGNSQTLQQLRHLNRSLPSWHTLTNQQKHNKILSRGRAMKSCPFLREEAGHRLLKELTHTLCQTMIKRRTKTHFSTLSSQVI